MDQNFPKADEVCKIIATCRRAGVSSLKLGVLEVVFGAQSAPPLPVLAQVSKSGAAPTPAAEVPEETIRAQHQVEQDSIEEQGIQTREEQIAELIITDPLKAEEMMMDGDLLEPEGSTDGSSGSGISGEALDQ